MARTYPYPPGESKVKWISTEWLADNIDDDHLMVLDVQPNVHDYIMGHLPGAVYLNEGIFRSAWGGLPAAYAPMESLKPILSRAGLDADRAVAVYSSAGRYSRCAAGLGDGLEQTMMAYSLVRFGHNNIYILDGGLERWKEEGRELTKVFPRREPREFKAELRKYFVDLEEFKSLKDGRDVVLFDARPLEVYREGGLWIKRGHIPGAHSLPWRSLMSEENPRLLKRDEELRQIVDKFKVTPEKIVLIYCGTGREATNEFLFFKFYLGHERVFIYEGSFTEWASYPENPTVVGENPR
jgi:thiosulfate/3-mercaptopyruvate sulfurtransferase